MLVTAFIFFFIGALIGIAVGIGAEDGEAFVVGLVIASIGVPFLMIGINHSEKHGKRVHNQVWNDLKTQGYYNLKSSDIHDKNTYVTLHNRTCSVNFNLTKINGRYLITSTVNNSTFSGEKVVSPERWKHIPEACQ